VGLDVNRTSTCKEKKLGVYAIKLDFSARNRRFVQFAESIRFLAVCSVREVDKHPTTRITDNLLSAVRACSNRGIENVPSVCGSETIQE
jgi:hypothetical protein